jgi:hypothetical protein
MLIPAVYYAWAYSTSGQTSGKSLLGIKVVSIDGSSLDWRKGILRYVGYILSGIPLCLGFLWSIWDPDKQAWHDKIAGTCVVRASVAPEQLQGTIDPSEARRRQKRWLLGLGIATLLIVVGCGGVGLLFSQSIQSGTTAFGQQDEWIAVTDAFMSAMASEDLDKARALCSTQLLDELPVSEMESLLTSSMFALFDGYQAIEISSWEITFNPDGKFVELRAAVTYEKGFDGHLDAVLKEEGQEWKLVSFYINIPPEKIKEYVKGNL